MCNPAVIPLIASAVSGAVTAYGKYQQGKFQEGVAKNNSLVQKRMAEDAIQRGERDEQKHRLKVAAFKAEQRAAFGASGRDISGSALEVLSDTAMMGELDALTIRSNAQREAYGHEVGATNFRAEGKLARMQGNQAAAGTLLSSAGKVSGKWNAYKKGS